jgi:hypothetical protein
MNTSKRVSTPLFYLGEGRRVINKLHTFSFRKKLDRLFGVRLGDEAAILACLRAFRAYIHCVIPETADVRVTQLKLRLVFHADALLTEMERLAAMTAGKRKALNPDLVVRVRTAYAQLADEVYRTRYELNVCADEWGRMINAGVRIWGDRL